jgi:nitrite reductase/ring-hydroxylating ferredoxin subunit
MSTTEGNWSFAGKLDQVRAAGKLAVQLDGHAVVLITQGERIYALDNRCPHMGFPLERGTVKDGILTCHWHHARFDMESGGTFDPWADDVRGFPVEVRNGEVWVDLAWRGDLYEHHRRRLNTGLERDLSLVIGKSVLSLMDSGGDAVDPFIAGLEFGATFRRGGWGQGLTILTCLMNLLPALDPADRPRALYHGLSAVSRETAGSAPRFRLLPLPGAAPDFPTLKLWFRRFVEVRDAEGAERCLVTAVRAGIEPQRIAEMLFTAATDHRYIQIGHVVDFTNKAFEALDIAGWQYAESTLTSLANGYTGADRMEESNAWRNPIDLVEILETAFDRLPGMLESGPRQNPSGERDQPGWNFQDALIQTLLGDDPQAIAGALLDSLRDGLPGQELASAVSYAAALRIARFHTSNEFGDWDTALHTFTFANAIEAGYRRAPSAELLRGVFDAAMSVYLDRFLNIPAARLPKPGSPNGRPENLLPEFFELFDKQQQVNQAGDLSAQYLFRGGEAGRLLASLGKLLLREDRDFHTIQTVEAAFRQYRQQRHPEAKAHILAGAARYLAAHAPTVRSQGQTYEIAHRLHRGERLFEEALE